MIVQEKEGLRWLEFKLLAEEPKLRHGIFLSECGDVRDCLDKIAQVMEAEEVVKANGSHGCRVAFIEKGDRAPDGHDALATRSFRTALLATHADCQAAIFYDPLLHACSVVHSGWRGSVQNIYAKTVGEMWRRFGSRPENLLVGISPSLGPEKAEFINYKQELPESFWPFQIRPCYFDFWAISEWQLAECGILPHHIEAARLCTFDDPKNFFSYRRDKTTKRNGACCNLLPP